jgi:hypothetical protein
MKNVRAHAQNESRKSTSVLLFGHKVRSNAANPAKTIAAIEMAFRGVLNSLVSILCSCIALASSWISERKPMGMTTARGIRTLLSSMAHAWSDVQRLLVNATPMRKPTKIVLAAEPTRKHAEIPIARYTSKDATNV